MSDWDPRTGMDEDIGMIIAIGAMAILVFILVVLAVGNPPRTTTPRVLTPQQLCAQHHGVWQVTSYTCIVN